MGDYVNANLEEAREQFGDGPLYAAEEQGQVTVDGVDFVVDYASGSTPDRFYIVKPIKLVEAYRELATGLEGSTIVELGIAEGGSTAFLALLAKPRKLVAVDLEPQPLAALLEFIEQRGLTDVVRPRFGVDQADRSGLAAIVDAERDGHPIDLVIDDASHQLVPTRVSFETLFPRLRPGGRYLIEDWNADIVFRAALAEAVRSGSPEEKARFRESVREALAAPATSAPTRPLSDLAVELLLARATGSSDAVAEVTIGPYWVTVTRGEGHLDPDAFRLSDLFDDHFGNLPGR